MKKDFLNGDHLADLKPSLTSEYPGLVTTSSIESPYLVFQRAKALNIQPAITINQKHFWTIADAERIRNFVDHGGAHTIRFYKILESIIAETTEKNYDIPQLAHRYNVSEKKLKILLREYDKSGCIIVKSKL